MSTIITYDLTEGRREQLRRAALSSNDISAAMALRCYYMTIRRDPAMADLWLKYMAWRGDPRARRLIDEQRYLISEEEMRVLDSAK